MGFSTVPCNEFVDVLGSKAPVPGGGGASALVGAVGTALGNMVGALTVGKKKYADVEEEMKELMAKATTLQDELLHLIERDAEVFEPLSKAYGMPRETEGCPLLCPPVKAQSDEKPVSHRPVFSVSPPFPPGFFLHLFDIIHPSQRLYRELFTLSTGFSTPSPP